MKHKAVLITGAANGIGAAVVRRFLEKGVATLIAIDRDSEGLKRIHDVAPHDTRIFTLPVELTNHKRLAEQLLPVLNDVNCIETVVISHGVADENLIGDNAIWDKVIDVNLNSTQRLLSLLEPNVANNGSIVVISSILGLIGKLSNTAYCSSKHGLLGLVKGLALDLARRKIRVNAILPSWVDTQMLRGDIKKQANMTGISEKNMIRRIKKRIPLSSLVSAEDVADSVVFFSSKNARMITAQSIVIDGGEGCGL